MATLTLQLPETNTLIASQLFIDNNAVMETNLGQLESTNFSANAAVDASKFASIAYKFYDQEVLADTGSVSIPNIPTGIWSDILILAQLKLSGATDENGFGMRFNSISSGNYYAVDLTASLTVVSSAGITAQTVGRVGVIVGSNTANANDFSTLMILIPQYQASSSFGKPYHSWSTCLYNASTTGRIDMCSGQLAVAASPAAINQVTLFPEAGGINIKANSRISLYLK